MNPPVIPAKPDIVMPPTTVTTSTPTPPTKSRKALFAIIGVILLTITTVSGFILIARPILYKSNAWNCGAYTFSLSSNGTVLVTNGSASNEPLQRADVYINNQLVQTFDVPDLASGESKTLGVVTVPTTSFTWQITGTSDCSNSGRFDVTTTSYQCQNIKAYSEDGSTLYTGTTLSTLIAGSKIRLVAVGSGSASNYSAVRFTVNGTLRSESTLKTTNGDYYEIYTLPTGVKSFAVTAQLKGSDGNWY